MLRITTNRQPQSITLKLEGKLLSAWCHELELASASAARAGLPVQLDLFDVSFIDADGTALLRTLVAKGFAISRCSNFVAELLHDTEKV